MVKKDYDASKGQNNLFWFSKICS